MAGPAVKTVDDAVARELRQHWEDGWNHADLATIMAPFAADVVFSSPFVPKLVGDAATTTIEGYEALRTYVADSLRRAPGIRYTVDAVCVGTDSLVLLYTVHRPDGTDKAGADLMRIDADGKVVEWRCHYVADFLDGSVRYQVDEAT
jgi:hypothetical protein